MNDRRNSLGAGFAPAFDINRSFIAMFAFGAGMLRAQRQLLTSMTRATPPAPILAPAEPSIAVRAHQISESPEAGSDVDNWVRAERQIAGD